jgi:hypothetical protein
MRFMYVPLDLYEICGTDKSRACPRDLLVQVVRPEGQQLHPRFALCLGIASFTEDSRNRVAIVGLQDNRILVESEFSDYADFVTLVEMNREYPARALPAMVAQRLVELCVVTQGAGDASPASLVYLKTRNELPVIARRFVPFLCRAIGEFERTWGLFECSKDLPY